MQVNEIRNSEIQNHEMQINEIWNSKMRSRFIQNKET